MPKKPYRLKLTDKQSLLGMPSSRDWVLLANYSDKTLLRNTMAHRSRHANIGMPWTPRSAFVEVYLNDRYDGVYQLIENIKVAKDRVNIDELADDDVTPDLISGGYLLEVDFREDGHTMYSSIDDLPIVFQDPGGAGAGAGGLHQGLHQRVRSGAAFERISPIRRPDMPPTSMSIRSSAGTSSTRCSAIVDANMWSSCWMYKPRGGKLFMGPLWDFDHRRRQRQLRRRLSGTAGWHIRDAPWFSRLFEDPAFAARVRLTWNEIKADQLPAMFAGDHGQVGERCSSRSSTTSSAGPFSRCTSGRTTGFPAATPARSII